MWNRPPIKASESTVYIMICPKFNLNRGYMCNLLHAIIACNLHAINCTCNHGFREIIFECSHAPSVWYTVNYMLWLTGRQDHCSDIYTICMIPICCDWQAGKTIVLIFTMHGSTQFHGVARVTNVIAGSSARELIAPGVPATLQLDWWKKYVLHVVVTCFWVWSRLLCIFAKNGKQSILTETQVEAAWQWCVWAELLILIAVCLLDVGLRYSNTFVTISCWPVVIIARMWAYAQRDGHPAEYRWRPLLNAAKFG